MSYRILIIDDEIEVASMLQSFLQMKSKNVFIRFSYLPPLSSAAWLPCCPPSPSSGLLSGLPRKTSNKSQEAIWSQF